MRWGGGMTPPNTSFIKIINQFQTLTLSKQWFIDTITRYTEKRKYAQGLENSFKLDGIIEGLNLALIQQSRAPESTSLKPKDIDINKGYESIVKYYMKKGYAKEHANSIAIKTIFNKSNPQKT